MKKSNAKSLLLLAGFVAVIFGANLVTGCSKDEQDNNNCLDQFNNGFSAAVFGDFNDPNNPFFFPNPNSTL